MDDAAGGAFDKAARVLGLPYLGGPCWTRGGGGNHSCACPTQPGGRYDYSFSGVKTAFLNAVNKLEMTGLPLPKADLAASFRHAVVEQLTGKAMLAARETGATKLALAGGVSANRELRRRMTAECEKAGLPLYMPELRFCGDNGAMIGSAAYWRFLRGPSLPRAAWATPECGDTTKG